MITIRDTYTQTPSFPVHFRWNFRKKFNPKNFLSQQKIRREILGGVSWTIFDLSGLFPPLSAVKTLLAKNSQKSTQLLTAVNQPQQN